MCQSLALPSAKTKSLYEEITNKNHKKLNNDIFDLSAMYSNNVVQSDIWLQN